MTSISNDLHLAVSWLWHAMPEQQAWSGSSAKACSQAIHELLAELRAVTW